MRQIERNCKIVKEKMVEQMELALEFGRELVETELDAGLLNFIVKPVVKTFYDYWSENDAREGTMEQIEVTLECGKILLNNGAAENSFDNVVEKYFPEYLAGDQASRQCKKSHKNYERLKELTKETFISQIKEVLLLLQVEKDVDTYEDLCRETFDSKQEAYNALVRQLNYTEKAIEIIEKDPSILKIPTGKKIIIKALRKGFEATKKELMENLEETYN
ncbi:MAG: hypothetical protein BAJALOKI2v1_30021 [Promethearchaeota archaeon]|nr:MAG: hypothetical protein BAJALOKI2v1_30021 [Candidatus Lokiarchaeota archaeon]